MGKVISGVLFLALIAAAVIGAKLFVFDPMQKDKALKDTKSHVQQLVDNQEFEKALKACKELQDKYPDQKAFCNKRRFQVYVEWASFENDECNASKNKWSRAKGEKKLEYEKEYKRHAKSCLKALKNSEKYGELTKVEWGWRVTSYGELDMKTEARAAMKTRAQLDE